MKKQSKMQKQLAKITAAKIAECYEQREDILKAFVAKYGFEPDQCRQIEHANLGWLVVSLKSGDASEIRDEVIRDNYRRKLSNLNLWQRFCIWMARL